MITIEYDAADEFELNEALRLWNRTLPGHMKRLISIVDETVQPSNGGRAQLMIPTEGVLHLREKGFQFEVV